MLRAQVTALGHSPGKNLQRAHWGLYASGSIDRAVQYNDRIDICTLDAPLTDMVKEPTCSASVQASMPRDGQTALQTCCSTEAATGAVCPGAASRGCRRIAGTQNNAAMPSPQNAQKIPL